MTTQQGFLAAVSAALGRTAPLEAPGARSGRSLEPGGTAAGPGREILARAFADCSREIGAAVVETTRAGLPGALRSAVASAGPGPVVVANDPLLGGLGPAEALLAGREVRVWGGGSPREELVGFAARAAAGLAVATMALAESATVLLLGGGSSVSLLPESVLFVVPSSRIRPRLTEGMEFLSRLGALPAAVHFVSGPSATSDIELIRVVGVHGPVHVTHIVVGDM